MEYRLRASELAMPVSRPAILQRVHEEIPIVLSVNSFATFNLFTKGNWLLKTRSVLVALALVFRVDRDYRLDGEEVDSRFRIQFIGDNHVAAGKRTRFFSSLHRKGRQTGHVQHLLD